MDGCIVFWVYNLRYRRIWSGVKISLKVEYACRVLAQLAGTYGRSELPHVEELARAEEIPSNYLVQILNELRSGGLIVSRRGKQGGYALSRRPEEITLYDIITAIDGEVLAISGDSKGASGDRVSRAWAEIAAALEQHTKVVTLENFVADSRPMYYI